MAAGNTSLQTPAAKLGICQFFIHANKVVGVVGLLLAAVSFEFSIVVGNAATLGPVLGDAPGRVYVFRGIPGPFSSHGIDRLTERIEHAGVKASVNDFTSCKLVAKAAIEEYRRKPVPIAVIGHSAGANCAVRFAELLRGAHIPVGLLVTIEPTRFDPILIAQGVSSNVERYINIFKSNSLFGGGDVLPADAFSGHYASFDLSEHDDINHSNIQDIDSIQQQLVTKITRLAGTQARSLRQPIPIYLEVPPGAAIELWDSGVVVRARGGETLKGLANAYHRPVWSLMQLNQLPDRSPLVAGEPVVVPRHLVSSRPSAEPVSATKVGQ